MDGILDRARALGDQICALRRGFHRRPELSHREEATMAGIGQALASFGIPFREVPDGGLIAELRGGGGPRLALRADIDALPVAEETGLPFASENPGVAHVCGHDAHIASALGAAAILSERKPAGTVIFCFQRAEEVMGGAKQLVAAIKESGGADMAAGFHFVPGRGREIEIPDASCNAGSIAWRAVMRGAGGHGSSPWLARDPIRPISELILRMTSLSPAEFPPTEPFVVSPCRVTAGSADNVIPESAEAVGTIRTFRAEQRDAIVARLERLAADVGASYGVEGSFRVLAECPPVVNTPEAARLARECAAAIGLRAVPGETAMWSDNIAEYIAAFGGFFAHIPATPPDRDVLMLHKPGYTVDESVMVDTSAFLAGTALSFCGER